MCTETHRSLCPPLPTPSALDCQSKHSKSSIQSDLSSRWCSSAPIYLRTLDSFWKGRGLKSIRLSTGFMLINTALELCEHVHVYGFWPFDTDMQNNPVPYHYYDELSPHRYKHKMPEEFVRLLQLHSQGALTLHLTPCMDV